MNVPLARFSEHNLNTTHNRGSGSRVGTIYNGSLADHCVIVKEADLIFGQPDTTIVSLEDFGFTRQKAYTDRRREEQRDRQVRGDLAPSPPLYSQKQKIFFRKAYNYIWPTRVVAAKFVPPTSSCRYPYLL
jgi:hypothetical protein